MKEPTEVDIKKAKTRYFWMQFSFFTFMFFVVAGSVASAMTQRDWPLNFVPFLLVSWIWSAVAMRKLAEEISHHGWAWGWLAILFPVIGISIGYVFVGRPAKKLINQIRWKYQQQNQ